MQRSTLFATLSVLLSSTLAAQLPLSFNFSFVDNAAGGNGNIGVTQDEVTFSYHVIDFSNTFTVHSFDLLGNPTGQFTTTGCTPALASPNDVTYDPYTQTLWFVDNSGNKVLNMDLQGNCLGGWTFVTAGSNPTGITFNRNTLTLFISYTGGVQEFDTAGNPLTGGFNFVPPTGSSFLSGITHVPSQDRFLITGSGGSRVFETDASGNLLSTTDLSSTGIVNTQGLHYNPLLQQLSVVDNSLSTVFVFDLAFCAGSVVAAGTGCPDGGGTNLHLATSGCPDLGTTLTLTATASNDSLPILFLIGNSDSMAPGGLSLPVDLGQFGAPGCLIYTSSEGLVGVQSTGGVATQSIAIPNQPSLAGTPTFWQAAKLDPALTTQLQIATSNYLSVTVR